MFRPEHRIRWKRTCTVEVFSDWSQDTGSAKTHEERREAGQEEVATVRYHGGCNGTATIEYSEQVHYSDSSSGRMINMVDASAFEIIGTY